MKPEELKALQREIQIHKTLVHPNIVPLVAAFEKDQKLFIFLESLRTNLFEYMQPRTFDEETALRFFREVVKAVAYLHQRKLVHRDIKPENVLLDENRRVKLCDFGFSAPIQAGEKRDTFCGTQQYLPPEIVMGHEQTDKVDIWCLGVLLFELIHKRVPFTNKSIPVYLDAVAKRNISFISKVSPAAKKLILSCLEMDPSKRPTAVQILSESLMQEGGVKGMGRASSVVCGERPNKHNPKALGIQGHPADGGAHSQSHSRPGTPMKGIAVINSDKLGKDLTPSVPVDNWFAEVFDKKPKQVTPQPANMPSPTRPTPTQQGTQQAPQMAGNGTPSPIASPIKINFYKNTGFGPENFAKKSQTGLTAQQIEVRNSPNSVTSPNAKGFFGDASLSLQQPKHSASTAYSSHNQGNPEPQGTVVRLFSPIRAPQSGGKDSVGFQGQAPQGIIRRLTDLLDGGLARNGGSPVPQQRMTMSPNTTQVRYAVQMPSSNPTSTRPIPSAFSTNPVLLSPQSVSYPARPDVFNLTRPSDSTGRSISPRPSPFPPGFSHLPPADQKFLLLSQPSPSPQNSHLGRSANPQPQSRSPNRS